MPKHNNVLFILADQFRADCIGAAGNPIIQTPNLDSLASEGVLFSHCFNQTTPCGPSRQCIFSGRYLCSTRTVRNGTPHERAEQNIGMYLRDAGWKPAAAGYHDYTPAPPSFPENDPRREKITIDFLPGFDCVINQTYDSPEYFAMLRAKGYPENLLNHEAIHKPNVPESGPGNHESFRFPGHYKAEDSEAQFLTTQAINHIETNKNSTPGWFLNLNYIKPHPPRIAAAPFNDMYNLDEMPSPNRDSKEIDSDHPYLKMMKPLRRLKDERELKEVQANYYAMITELDVCLGKLFRYLKETGQWEDTLVIFSSDHGEYLGDHYFQNKAHFYDETMRIPCIIRDPSSEADSTRGMIVPDLCESIDLIPTILEFSDTAQPPEVQGKSLLPKIRETQSEQHKEFIYHEYDFRSRLSENLPIDVELKPEECLMWAIRSNEYKLVQFGPREFPPLLFNLKTDPKEQNDIANDPESIPIIAEYSQHLLRWRMRNEDQRMEQWAQDKRKGKLPF